MTEHAQQPGTVISVSGEAEHVVAPDFATLATSLSAVGPDKDAVLEQVTRAHGATLDALRQLGGVALSVATTGAPLTWSTRSFSAHVWHEHDYRTGDSRPAGWRADVPVTIVLRDLGRLS